MNKKNKEIVIYLADLAHNHIPGNYTVPLNVAYIGAYIMKLFGDVVDLRLFKYPNDLLDACKQKKPDILGLSNYLWNKDLNFQIGTYLKEEYSDLLILLGGPSFRTGEKDMLLFLRKNEFVDFVCVFEGETTFANFVKKYIEKGTDIIFEKDEKISGLAFLLGGKGELIYSPSSLIQDLSEIPSPYLGGLLDPFLNKGLIPLFESNRGCPFSCTYCAWGISALRKIRKFPLERLFEEMEYVSKKYPDSPYWIFADANFGIFERDVDIAKKINEIKKYTPGLGKVILWASKNSSERNKRISKYIGSLYNQLMAVQTLDPIVKHNIKRENVKQDDIPLLIKYYMQNGIQTSTDVIGGLPGETKKSHMETLRKCFDYGFDFIGARVAILLEGSEMEKEKSRMEYGLKTAFRIRQGSYGEYGGIKSIEYEEIVRETSTLTKEDTLDFRLIHWLIDFGWNLDFLKPILKYLHLFHQYNPLDFIKGLIDAEKTEFPLVENMFANFLADAEDDWFESSEKLKEFYMETSKWDILLKNGFSKLTFKYIAELILDDQLFNQFCDFLFYFSSEISSSKVINDLICIIRESRVDPFAIAQGELIPQKKLDVTTECLSLLFNDVELMKSKLQEERSIFSIVLRKEYKEVKPISKRLKQFNFDKNPRVAIEKTLETFNHGFTYNIQYGGSV